MDPVYYSVYFHFGHRDPRKRLSYELLIQLIESALSGSHECLAIDAAKSVLRRSLRIHSQWDIYAGRIESPEIPTTTPNIAENGCRVRSVVLVAFFGKPSFSNQQ
jgi:hypothetical protein